MSFQNLSRKQPNHEFSFANEEFYAQVTVIIPTLNEEKTISVLLQRITNLYPGMNIIVADDNSQDQTPRLVTSLQEKKGFHVSLLARVKATQRGITASVIDALLQCQTPYFIVMDGDLQHPPEALESFCLAFRSSAVLAVGTRRNYRGKMPFYRYLLSRGITLLAQVACLARNLHVRDPLSGFFGGETLRMKNLIQQHQDRFEPKGYKVLFDLLRIIEPQTPLEEIPFHFADREDGKSKCGIKHGLYFLRSILR